MKSASFPLLVLLTAIVLAGCAQTKSHQAASVPTLQGKIAQVMVMPVDVQIAQVTTSGLKEPNAAWTEQGVRSVEAGLRAELAGRQVEVSNYQAPDDPLKIVAPEHEQILKLHEAVGRSILIHKYLPGYRLPTQEDRFNWTLGRGAGVLKEDTGADYALFVYARDSFASAGRVAYSVFMAALFGVNVPLGQQEAFASLVDLESGRIAWFNVLTSKHGDLRERESARNSMESLLEDAPI